MSGGADELNTQELGPHQATAPGPPAGGAGPSTSSLVRHGGTEGGGGASLAAELGGDVLVKIMDHVACGRCASQQWSYIKGPRYRSWMRGRAHSWVTLTDSANHYTVTQTYSI